MYGSERSGRQRYLQGGCRGSGKAQAAAATEKVEAAEAADKAAKDKLAELNADKLITPEEKAQLETAKQNADTLKGEADSAVKALPDTAAEKGGLQGRVDALDGIRTGSERSGRHGGCRGSGSRWRRHGESGSGSRGRLRRTSLQS
ncbi:GA-like domain-containing protein [Escherichia coli]|uniref:GA-like domain-containing protein n=1 Tax=Escherichia coli TaxID=562 RepID=UPI00193221FA|nr:hypothetical protein [Escherichia coli]